MFLHFRARVRGLLHAACVLLAACATPPAPVTAPVSEDPARLRETVLQVIRENPAVILASLQAYERERAQAAQAAEEAALRARIAAANLPAQIGSSPVTGATAGRRLLFVFSDFQCPFCARANAGLRAFGTKYASDVTLVYKYLPLADIHPEATAAARAAWAAHRQGRFWEFHDALFAHQQALGDAEYRRIARGLGLDLARFERDRASPEAGAEIERDLALADRLGVSGTPFFVLGDEPLAGALPLAAFEAALAKVKSRAGVETPKP